MKSKLKSKPKKLKIKIVRRPVQPVSQPESAEAVEPEMNAPPNLVPELRAVETLNPHPRQAELTPTTEQEDELLRQDLQDNGQREPIEITSDGTIISGHRRWRLAQALQWDEVCVVVRRDLEAKGQAAVDYRFYEANRNRRNLTMLQQARLAYRMLELMPKGRERRGQGSVREELQQQFGRSGRQLERLMPLVEGPVELFQAVERKQLPANRALEALKKLKEKQLRQVVGRLQNGDPPKAVLADYLPREPRRKSEPVKPKNLYGALALCQKYLDADPDKLRQACEKDPALHGSLERVRERLEAFFNQRPRSKSASKGGPGRRKPR
ncbi:MAG: ParB/RepB/Spo0J family partition protein [Pirellulales bacterium]